MLAADRAEHVTTPAGKEFVKVMGQYFADLQEVVAAGAQVKVSSNPAEFTLFQTQTKLTS